jgi:hypothetical protein
MLECADVSVELIAGLHPRSNICNTLRLPVYFLMSIGRSYADVREGCVRCYGRAYHTDYILQLLRPRGLNVAFAPLFEINGEVLDV